MHEGHEHHHEHGEADRRTALLKYMLDHNRHHAEELEQTAAGLEADGAAQAAKLVRDGAAKLLEGSESLAAAVKLLGDGK